MARAFVGANASSSRPHFLLDTARFTPRMRAPMHPNYRKSFDRPAFAALPQRWILANRRSVPARAFRDAGESDVLMP